MKNFSFLILCILCPFFLNAQKGKRAKKKQTEANLKYFNQIFGKKDKDFEITKTPEKWKSEPIVLLCQKLHISFLRDPNQKSNKTKGVIRKRILIQDKAALADLSEFYYRDSDAIGIQLIKPNGKIENIDLTTSVTVKTEVPSFYMDTYHSSSFNKVAIPNLEVGDIIDYFKVFTESYNSRIELITPIAYTYPVVRQEIIFDIDKLWSFYFDTFNGAPAFQKDEQGGIDFYGRKRKMIKRFVFKDENRPALKRERWDYTSLTEPIFKIAALPPGYFLSGERIRGKIENRIDLKNAFFNTVASREEAASLIRDALATRFKELKLKEMPPKKQIEMIYYALRYEFLIHNTSYKVDSQEDSRNLDEFVTMESDLFASIFTDILKQYKIESSLVMIAFRRFGNLSTVVMEGELEYGVYIPLTQKYYWTVDNYRSLHDEYPKVCGSVGFKTSKKPSNKKESSFEEITIPVSKATNNTFRTDLDIIVQTTNSLTFDISCQFTGIYKRIHSPLFLSHLNYLEEDFRQLTSQEKIEKIIKQRNEKELKASKELFYKRKRSELREENIDAIENWLRDYFKLEELKDFGVVAFGRFTKEEPLQIAISFSSKGYLKKAGPNLALNIGQLITEQTALKEEEIQQRHKAIELDFARTIENNIKITLPNGYKAEGLDQLMMQIDNEHAAFLSEATQEGNILTVKTTKIYKNATIPAMDWDKLVEMLEAAYKFSQLKIILKK